MYHRTPPAIGRRGDPVHFAERAWLPTIRIWRRCSWRRAMVLCVIVGCSLPVPEAAAQGRRLHLAGAGFETQTETLDVGQVTPAVNRGESDRSQKTTGEG